MSTKVVFHDEIDDIRPFFKYKDVIIDEQNNREKLIFAAQSLGIINFQEKSNIELCDSIYKILINSGKFYNKKYVTNSSGHPFHSEYKNQNEKKESKYQIENISESEIIPTGTGVSEKSRNFLFPASIPGWKNFPTSRSLQEKRYEQNLKLIKRLKEKLFLSPDIQIAGKLDLIPHIKPIGIESDLLETKVFNTCRDEYHSKVGNMENEKEEIMNRHKELLQKIKTIPRILNYFNISKLNRFNKLVQIVTRCAKLEFQEFKNILGSLSSEGFDLNRPIQLNKQSQIPELSLEKDLCLKTRGRNLLQIAVVCPNLFSDSIDAFLYIHELLNMHNMYNLKEMNVNFADSHGDTALLLALQRCHYLQTEIQALRIFNSSSKTKPKDRISELDLKNMSTSAFEKMHDIVLLLGNPAAFSSFEDKHQGLDRIPVNMNKDNKGITPLHIAVRSNCLKCINIIQRHGKNLDATVQDYETGRTALMDAVLNDNPLLVYKILQEKNDFRKVDKDGRTVFHHAARHGMQTCLKRHPEQLQDLSQLIVSADYSGIEKDEEKKKNYYYGTIVYWVNGYN